jgi:selenocysteine-specific translation elongation factor
MEKRYHFMSNLTVAVIGPEGFAGALGKKGTTSDITFYNLKRGADTVTLIEPARYPDKLSSLWYAVGLADMAIVAVREITPQFGETAIMLECAGVHRGMFVLQDPLTKEELTPVLRDCALGAYAVIRDNPLEIRESLLKEAAAVQVAGGPGSGGSVAIDHAYTVRGIGTVVLGTVTSGTVHRHETLTLLPGSSTAQVRSIQKHDDDFDSAVKGDRVGLALKNIEASEISRGDVLSGEGSDLVITSRFEGKVDLVRYWRQPLREGMVLHLGHWMQFVPVRVDAVHTGDGSTMLSLSLDKPLVHPPGARGVLTYLEGGKLRVAGTMRIP